MSSSSAHPRLSSLSAVFPAYNDAATIPGVILAAALASRQVTCDYEIIVVDDGSRDHTAQVLDELALLLPYLQVIHHPGNQEMPDHHRRDGDGESVRRIERSAVRAVEEARLQAKLDRS